LLKKLPRDARAPERTHLVDLGLSQIVTSLASDWAASDQVGNPVVDLRFTPADGARFAELTTKLVGRRLAVLLDDDAILVARVQTPMPGGRAYVLADSRAGAEWLAVAWSAGALPGPRRRL
jgi:preprotein translocase subunit SecD